LTVDSIQIYAGQRYSFVLNANQPIRNYWIRADPNFGSTGFAGGLNSAILRYLLAPNADPTTSQVPNSNPLLETNLHPLQNPGAPGSPTPGAADVNINLAIVFDFPTLTYKVNGAGFSPPTAPVLLQILSGAQTAQDLLPPGNVYVLPPNKVIEITIPGGSIGSPVSRDLYLPLFPHEFTGLCDLQHPFHLHGVRVPQKLSTPLLTDSLSSTHSTSLEVLGAQPITSQIRCVVKMT
jgi:hypothetical protein